MSEYQHENVFPLSLSQRNIWDLERTFEGTSINNISTTLRIHGQVNFTLLQKTLNLVIASDVSLRTRIILREDTPVQYSAPYMEESFPVYDFSSAGESGLAVWENTITREVIPLLDAPLYRFVLFRTGEYSGGVLVKIHHIISDGWSQALICNRIAKTYFELLQAQVPQLDDAPSYELHVQDEQDYLQSTHYQKDKNYWAGQLSSFSEPSVIKDLKGAAISPIGRRVSFQLPQHLNHAVYSFCIQNRVAPFAVFYMALAIYFKRIGGARRFTIGVPIFNRTSYLFKQCTGMFVSTLPFINEIDDSWSFSQFNEQLAQAWYELLRHQRFPFKDICALADSPDGRLFQIALSYQDSRIYESHDTSVLFSGRWHYSGYQAEQLCIHLSNLESPRQYAVDYDYLTQFFSQDEIVSLHESLMNLLTQALTNPEQPLCRLSMLSADEREQVLYTFNRTSRYLGDQDAYSVFARAAAQNPNRAALIHRGERLSYRALEERGACVAGALAECSQSAAGLAAILLPRDFSLFAAIVGVLRAGWAYLLLSEETPEGRASQIISQSGADVLISTPRLSQSLSARGIDIPVLDIERLPEAPEAPSIRRAKPEDLAYVVYTSGSTGAPKGVEITQLSLVNLAQAMESVYANGAVLSMCNIGFDAFVLESSAALLNGRTIVLPTGEDLENPRRLAHLVLNYAVGFLATTPSRLAALLKDREFYTAMRIMDSIVCGGEAFPRELLQTLSGCTSARVYNQYGPSEATVAVSHKLLNGSAAITAGTPLQNCRLYVLDEWRNPLPVGVYGELYIGGVCVGKGYRNAPELTGERFLPSPFESSERLYRTGDTACWTPQGEILLAGRRDRQIKLRGLRVEPQEISSCIASHPLVQDAAARVLELGGQTAIVVYYTSDTEIPEVELLTYAADYLPRYMIPSYLQRVQTIPLTANGKVDEARLPLPSRTAREFSQASTGLVREVQEVFSRVLEQQLGPDSDYFLCGGTSLSAMQTLSELEEKTGCQLRISDLYACRTASRLAQCIAQRTGAQLTAEKSPLRIPKAPALERYPLSPVQKGIYFQSMLDESGLLYNMSGAFLLESTLDAQRLQNAFESLIAQEELFRTSFVQEPDGVYAHVADSVPFHLQLLRGENFQQVSKDFAKPFDLSRAPLLRAGVWKTPDGKPMLFLDTHHSISDGISTPIIMRRLAQYYGGETPSLPEISYLDYSYFLSHTELASEDDKQYWSEHLSPMPSPLSLPTDFPRSSNTAGQFAGGSYSLECSRELSGAVQNFCREHGISAYTVFLAAFGYLLACVSGKEEFTVGSPVTDRVSSQLQEVCGPFLNVLPLKLRVQQNAGISSYLEQVSREVSGMMDHSACSPEEILSLLSLPRDPSRNPLYDVIISMRPFDVNELRFGDCSVQYFPIAASTTKAELGLDVALEGEIYSLQFQYASGLYQKATVALYARSLESILEGLVSARHETLGELSPISLEDYTQLIEYPDYVTQPFLNLPIHQQICREARLHPQDTAVICHRETTTRIQMERRACQIANTLVQSGAAPGGCIGISMRRTPDLFAGMLGILKTGCAYVPILSTLPPKRLSYMAETAGISIILCDEETLPQLPESLRDMAVVPSPDAPCQFQDATVGPGSLCNVLFTSGSTGRPKGVMIRHSSVSNLLSNMRQALACVSGPMICATTPIFDIFITESLLPLAMGKTIVLADEEEMLLPWRLAGLIEEFGAGFIQFTASRLSMCLTNDAFCAAARHLQFTIVGGEQVSPALVAKFKEHCSGRLVNLYGPTEACVYITMTDLTPGEPVTIGRPMHNCRVYVLGPNQERLTPTAVGELYLAGAGISAGYIAREDLTAGAFFPDPFVPGEMMYKSGDLGRLRADGSLDCLGRCDAQVKINGQRLEIDEILNTILDSGLVQQAVVVPVTGANSMVELHAFCVSASGCGGGEIAAYLREYLPSYMVPSRFHMLREIPFTPGGKADLTALKAMAAQAGNIKISAPEPVPEKEVSDETQRIASAQSTGFLSGKKASQALPAPAVPDDELIPQPQSQAIPAKDAASAVGNSADVQINARTPSIPPQTALPTQTVTERHPTPSSPASEALNTREILDIWGQILGKQGLSPTISFFEQGGTSLDALSVLSQYSNRQIKLSVAEFYQNPTAEAQARLLGAESQEQPAAAPQEAGQDAPFLPRYVPECENPAKPAVPECIFLTGATGFFGSHLLHALLSKGVRRAYCLVRGEPRRLFETLNWYFGSGWTAGVRGRITVLSGDIILERMGLSEEAYSAVCGEISAVYHAAADVRHYSADESAFLENNVAGTRAAIQLALDAHAILHHMSTLSVSGEYLTQLPSIKTEFSEQDFFMGQNWQENTYVKSKMLAEAQVYSAMCEKGLAAKVYRLGRLVGRASDGVFQRNASQNLTVLFLEAAKALGALPAQLARLTVDLTPVDWAAQATAALYGAGHTTFHIMNPAPPVLGELLTRLMPDLRVLDSEPFDALAAEKSAQPGAPRSLSLLMDSLNLYRSHPTTITPVCTLTGQSLNEAGFSLEIPEAGKLALDIVSLSLDGESHAEKER